MKNLDQLFFHQVILIHVELKIFHHEQKRRLMNQQCPERSFSEWVTALLGHVDSIDLLAARDS